MNHIYIGWNVKIVYFLRFLGGTKIAQLNADYNIRLTPTLNSEWFSFDFVYGITDDIIREYRFGR